ncbi:MAG: hypothetical protein H6R18_1638 [Proteobacteria bacterium]|nr:hypothetical protein [Pseudomonadota bacterium]
MKGMMIFSPLAERDCQIGNESGTTTAPRQFWNWFEGKIITDPFYLCSLLYPFSLCCSFSIGVKMLLTILYFLSTISIIILFFYLLNGSIYYFGTWGTLSRQFPANPISVDCQTARGSIGFPSRDFLKIRTNSKGIHIDTIFIFKPWCQPILIPWDVIIKIEYERLFRIKVNIYVSQKMHIISFPAEILRANEIPHPPCPEPIFKGGLSPQIIDGLPRFSDRFISESKRNRNNLSL